MSNLDKKEITKKFEELKQGIKNVKRAQLNAWIAPALGFAFLVSEGVNQVRLIGTDKAHDLNTIVYDYRSKSQSVNLERESLKNSEYDFRNFGKKTALQKDGSIKVTDYFYDVAVDKGYLYRDKVSDTTYVSEAEPKKQITAELEF